MSDALVSAREGGWAVSRGTPGAWHRAYVVERLGRFPYPAIAKMGGLSEAFVRAVADEIGFSPQPRVSAFSGIVIFPERGSRQPIEPAVREWRPSLPPNARKAIRLVCERHGLRLRDLMITSLTSNRRIYAWARQEAYAELLSLGYSSPRIGTWFKRDHSTVLDGRNAHIARQAQNGAVE